MNETKKKGGLELGVATPSPSTREPATATDERGKKATAREPGG
jgi:hypothetical protein